MEEMIPKICVVCIYFGPLPVWWPVWLRSAACNPAIDFLLVSDRTPENLPANVRLYSTTLPELKALTEEKLGMSVCLERPYKVCDFRPAWGEILAQQLSGYAYWGHCDLDMVFGDIAGFFVKYKGAQYDKFMALGHLALYRNTPEVNGAYRLPGGNIDYKTAFQSEKSCYFDEYGNINKILESNGFAVFHDVSLLVNTRTGRKGLAVYKTRNYPVQGLLWQKGKTYHVYEAEGRVHFREVLYLHVSRRAFAPVAFDAAHAEAFLIGQTAFVPVEGQVTAALLRQTNPAHLSDVWQDIRYRAGKNWAMRKKKLAQNPRLKNLYHSIKK